MNIALLDILKNYCREPNISYYNSVEERIIDCSSRLYSLTETKLNYISDSKDNCNRQLNIIIAESNPIEFLAAFMAGIVSQANIFLGDYHWQQQEWQQVLNLIAPDLIFASSAIKQAIDNCPTKIKNATDNLAQSLIMIPTGGSSGKIKFAIHNWDTLSASVRGFQKYFNCLEINSFCTLPLYHVSGLMQFMRSLLTQGQLTIYPYKIITPKKPIFNTQDYFISLVPTQLHTLIQTIPTWLPEFKTVLLGGASISRSLLRSARKYQIPLAPTYGMTETGSGVVILHPKDFLAGNNSNGVPLSHAEIILESQQQDKTGIIKIKGESLCLGYYPELFPQPYLLTTDDLGYFDAKGYLHILGRNSQKIITGGENVFPAEVEAAILETKLVKDVCVIGTSDRHWGQAVTAVCVLLNSSADLEIIKTQIKTQLANYKQPKHWIIVSSLPRNNRGKINYQQIKAIVTESINT